MDTAVLFVIFNRPETTRVVFEAIRKAAPTRLYVAADGPRQGRSGEGVSVATARDCVIDNVDWDCEVRTLFRDENLGCRLAVSGAITWFFEHEQEGVILEDDCLPDPSFFSYCEELLSRYREDERVMHIGGSCLIKDVTEDETYFFSKYPAIWGWATWRSAWSKFSLAAGEFETEFESVSHRFPAADENAYWKKMLGSYFAGEIDTWDYPWGVSIWKNDGLAIYPLNNLITNIGYGSGSTHTKGWKDYRGLGGVEPRPMTEIVHPAEIAERQDLDHRVFTDTYEKSSLPSIAYKVIRHLMNRARRGPAPDRTRNV